MSAVCYIIVTEFTWRTQMIKKALYMYRQSRPFSPKFSTKHMLTINENLIHTAAECHANTDYPGSFSYQQILHRNLIEMASFVDMIFGVYWNPKTLTAEGSTKMSGSISEKGSVDTNVPSHSCSSVLMQAMKAEARMRSLELEHQKWLKEQKKVQMRERARIIAFMSRREDKDKPKQHKTLSVPVASTGIPLTSFIPHLPSLYPATAIAVPCFNCIVNKKSSYECRITLRHTQTGAILPNSPLLAPNSALGLAMAARRPITKRITEASTAYKFKKVCVECRERHTSLHHCRKVYRHTAPEWTAERQHSCRPDVSTRAVIYITLNILMGPSATNGSSSPDIGLPSDRLRGHYIAALRHIIDSLNLSSDSARSEAGNDYDDIYIIPSHCYHHVFSYIQLDVIDLLQDEKRSLHFVDISDSMKSVHFTGRLFLLYLTFGKLDEVEAVTRHATKLLYFFSESAQSKQTRSVSTHVFTFGETTESIRKHLVMYQQRNPAFPPIKIAKFPISFLSLDSDLLLLGQENLLYDLFVRNEHNALGNVVTALQDFQKLFGVFESIKCKGQLSIAVANGLMEYSERNDHTGSKNEKKHQNRRYTLVVMDRSVDLVSPFITPLTYHALLDQNFGTRDGSVHLNPSIIPTDSKTPTSSLQAPTHRAEQVTGMHLNSCDPIFAQIRSSSIDTLPEMLKEMALEMKGKFACFQSTSSSATVADIQAFVKTIPLEKIKQQKLEIHIKLVEDLLAIVHSDAFRNVWILEKKMMDASVDEDEVVEKLETMISSDISLTAILRLVCLFSLVRGAISTGKYDQWSTLIQQKHGTKGLHCMMRLSELGILKIRSRTWTKSGESESFDLFQRICIDFNLLDMELSDHLAYVTGGYAPISCRIVEEIGRCGNWLEKDSTIKLLKGARIELTTCKGTKRKKVKSSKKRAIVVCILGGITQTEIAGLRWLSTICK
ncbi:hypothetical protein ABG067_004358 [Albugo candida]